jgi:DNA polymerase-3 subunit delta'
MLKTNQGLSSSIKLISLDKYLIEMIKLYESSSLPKVFLLNGSKGIGKFTLVFHFLNYIFSKNEQDSYNIKDKIINTNSNFYKSILKLNCSDVIFLQAEEGKNIKIDNIRDLKDILSRSTLSSNSRFIIIDEVEFLNSNSANALLKTLEEPTENNYFILINNQQADLIPTIASRCIKNNIFLNTSEKQAIKRYLFEKKKISLLIDDENLTPGLLLKYNELFIEHDIDINDNISLKLNKILNAYKKNKNKTLISMSLFLIDQFFFKLVKDNTNEVDALLDLKLIVCNKINDFITYNLNINSVLATIDLKLKNAK